MVCVDEAMKRVSDYIEQQEREKRAREREQYKKLKEEYERTD